MERDQFVKLLFERAKDAGLEACEIYMNTSDSFSVQVRAGELLSYDVAAAMGLGFRGLYRGRMGYASTQVLDEDAIDMLVSGAKANAELIENDDVQFIYPGDRDYVKPDADFAGLDALSAADKIAMAHNMEKVMLAEDPRIVSGLGGQFDSEVSEGAIFNSLGLNLTRKTGALAGFAMPNARDGEDVSSEYAYFVRTNAAEADPEATAKKAAQKALAALGGAPIPSGTMPILLAPEASFTMLSTFSDIFSADYAQKGLSLLKGREGEKIAADCVTIMDDPHLAGSIASKSFDGEGVATIRKQAVDEGVLTTLLHTLKNATTQGVKSTGTAVRSYASTVGVAPSNFYIVPGEKTQDALLDEMHNGLMITSVTGMHAGANAISGDFSLSAKGFKVENGRCTDPVSRITVAGNFFGMLKDIEDVGCDLTFGMPGGSCFGSPSIRIKSLAVAGK